MNNTLQPNVENAEAAEVIEELEIEFDDGEDGEGDQHIDGSRQGDPDSAPEGGKQSPKVVFTEEQQKVVDHAIGQKVHKLREKEREAESLKKQLEELQRKVPQQQRPVIPEIPDPLILSDTEYRRQTAVREQAIRNSAAYEMEQQRSQQHAQQVLAELQRKQQEVFNGTVQQYTDRATKLGMKPEELKRAGEIVGNFGIDEQLVTFILHDDHGPLITKYLAENPLILDELKDLSPARAAARIATEIKPKAATLKPKVNSAPDPLDIPNRSGNSPKQRGPAGASFE